MLNARGGAGFFARLPPEYTVRVPIIIDTPLDWLFPPMSESIRLVADKHNSISNIIESDTSPPGRKKESED